MFMTMMFVLQKTTKYFRHTKYDYVTGLKKTDFQHTSGCHGLSPSSANFP